MPPNLICVTTSSLVHIKETEARQKKREDQRAMPRPADIAVIISEMMVDLAVLIHQHEPYRRRNLGASLEEMFVSFMLNAAAGANRPLTPTEIAERLSIPRSNVRRHLNTLREAGRLRQVGNGYMTDLDQLNGNALPERFKDTKSIVTKASWELTRLRLDDGD
jgi:DNA-binding transcriptional ArsR family regulator